MQFSKVIGKIDPKLVELAEKKLSTIFLELAVKYDNTYTGTKLGGDSLLFSLLCPVEHICTMNMPTAATDGKRYYWNPKFILKNTPEGLRIICGHEAWHALYMHPARRGSRLPKLWNIAVDYIVNGTVMEDFSTRKKNPTEMFEKYLGKFMTLEQYSELLKNPFAKIKGFENLDPTAAVPDDPNIKLPKPGEDRELTPEEQKELEKREKKASERFFFADANLSEDMKSPEKIYDYLYKLLPKCPECGSVGIYKVPSKGKGKDKNQGDSHNHGKGESCDCPDCGTCGGGIDIFDLGGTVDDHLDTEESQEKLAKRISEAMEAARKLAGHVPSALEDELGKLTAPKISWQDIIRSRLLKARAGNGRNDWTRFKSRPMFSGLLVPKKRSYFANFGCLLDCSGSMSSEDIAFGLSQLISLDDKAEGMVVNADAEIYWSQAEKVKKCNVEELSKIKRIGGGGTLFGGFFSDYEKYFGKCDFLILVTDGFLDSQDVASMKDPGIPVYWLVTSGATFAAPFGRIFDLRNN